MNNGTINNEQLAMEEGNRERGANARYTGADVQVCGTDCQVGQPIAGIEVGRRVVRSATSIGANVEEADAAESKRDFVHKMSIAHKEARETRYWLRIVGKAGRNPHSKSGR